LVEETIVVLHVILTKKEVRMGIGREIARHKMRKPKKKKFGIRWIFEAILILVMIEDEKWKSEKKRKEKKSQDRILVLAYSSDTIWELII